MRENKIDIPVLLIFFCRPNQLKQVFEQVKIAAPSKLYLYQDGARPGREDDLVNIASCREIVESIDWDCEVHRLYQEKNQGCDPSEYIAQRWMFSSEEYGIVLEDDDVPSQAFFPFCKQLLEKYKNDSRINMICGMNNEGVSEYVDSSYFFSTRGSIWGWASWSRVVMEWNPKYPMLDDSNSRRLIQENYPDGKSCIQTWEKLRDTGRDHYEGILGSDAWANGRVNIIPKFNMITSVGISADSTHSVNDIRRLSRWTQRLFGAKRYEISFPLIHPISVLPDRTFEKHISRNWLQKKMDCVEGIVRRLIFR